MKRFFVLAASACVLAACLPLEEEQNLIPSNDIFEGELVDKVVFKVLPIKNGDDLETKASAIPDGGVVDFVWEATDTVGIIPNKGSQVYFDLKKGAGTNTASFDGGAWALKQGATYESYYPCVGGSYLKRDRIPVSFSNQKQIGTTPPFNGARYILASDATSSSNGELTFTYSTLNTIININATLPAGTYKKAFLAIEEPLFVEKGYYSMADKVIVGTKFTNTLKIDLQEFTLTEQSTVPIYIMSAPVDLKNKQVIVRIVPENGGAFECIKTPSTQYLAGYRHGLTCPMEYVPTSVPIPIDLGLSVKWASFNLGASAPDEFGDYFAWGETEPYYEEAMLLFDNPVWKEGKTGYNWESYRWCNGSDNKITKYCTSQNYWDGLGSPDNKTQLDPEDDAAIVLLGGDWRMPTYDECTELIENCTWEWIIENDVQGYRVTSNRPGYVDKSIFLPAAGFWDGAYFHVPGDNGDGFYWSSSLMWVGAGSIQFYSADISQQRLKRIYGMPIRPVYHIHPESIVLNKSTLSLFIDSSEQLLATFSPDNATDKTVTWSSDNTGIATVDADGRVRGISQGTAIITVTTNDGNLTATCSLTVKPILESEAVDLGLSVNWAPFNVGAKRPEEYGEYFAWGETEQKDLYEWDTYKWSNGSFSRLTKYCTESSFWDSTEPMDNKTILDIEDDAARVIWGGKWRMPTQTEWTELINNCTLTWTTQNGVNGRMVTGSNGNSFFLPAAGNWYSTTHANADADGYYWATSCATGVSCSRAWSFNFTSDSVVEGYKYSRYVGFPVRPVCPKE